MDNDYIPGQMTIFDFLPDPSGSLEDIPEEEMVRRVGEAIGVSFKPHELGGYRAKVGKYTLEVEYDRYFADLDDMDDDIGQGARFIGVGFFDKSGCGASAPTDSIKEAIEWFERHRR